MELDFVIIVMTYDPNGQDDSLSILITPSSAHVRYSDGSHRQAERKAVPRTPRHTSSREALSPLSE